MLDPCKSSCRFTSLLELWIWTLIARRFKYSSIHFGGHETFQAELLKLFWERIINNQDRWNRILPADQGLQCRWMTKILISLSSTWGAENRIWPRQHSKQRGARTWQRRELPQDASGKLFLHLRLGECSFFTIATFTSGVAFILRGCTHPTQHKSKFWLCDLGGVAVVKIGEFLCDPGRS